MRYAPPSPFPTWYSRATAHSCVPAAADWSRYCTGCERIGQTSVLDISVKRDRERVPVWVAQVDTLSYRLAGTRLMSDRPVVHGHFVNEQQSAVLRWLTRDHIHKTDITVWSRVKAWSFDCLLAGFVLRIAIWHLDLKESGPTTIRRRPSGQWLPISETTLNLKIPSSKR